ncbi:unnamed protein product [Pleuronectes platessa]|uniref:Uncharacterized protein n=1 Tax=Pleuronectes platessa TaxID=8262 RepID=A0A9N7UTX3_PLEPL|nr:unnamed protein product [Pleuronectes platessa]
MEIWLWHAPSLYVREVTIEIHSICCLRAPQECREEGRQKVHSVKRCISEGNEEAMLQVQLLSPHSTADATVTAHMKHDASKFEVEFKSDVNTQTTMLPSADMLEKYANQLLDAHVGEADMKVRHIFQKFGEAANNYMDKYGADLPYIQNVRVPDMPEISLPETLFLNTEAKASYYFTMSTSPSLSSPSRRKDHRGA